jgi:hypothetical protein
VEEFKLVEDTNLDFDGDKEDGFSTLGYLMSLGSIALLGHHTRSLF